MYWLYGESFLGKKKKYTNNIKQLAVYLLSPSPLSVDYPKVLIVLYFGGTMVIRKEITGGDLMA